MIPLMWGAIAGGLGLVWLTLETALAGEGGAVSTSTTGLWLILGPVCAVGAMVHVRRTVEAYPYGKALFAGFYTTFVAALTLLGVWILYVSVLNPEFFRQMLESVADESRQAGDTEQVVVVRVKAASLMFSAPAFYLIGFFIPMFSGAVASLIAAFGVRRKSA